jgi:hypothetical protein
MGSYDTGQPRSSTKFNKPIDSVFELAPPRIDNDSTILKQTNQPIKQAINQSINQAAVRL